jgi:hypothetical protein
VRKSFVITSLRDSRARAFLSERRLPWTARNAAQTRGEFCSERDAFSEELAMLRITTDDKPRVVTFRLEGRLEGPWAAELAKCWREMLADTGRPTLRVDLSGVTFADAAGKAQLAAMRGHGAQFIAHDCMTRDIVAEIGGELSGVAEMSEQLTQLKRLEPQLLEINQELARTATPLEQFSKLDEQQRRRLADELRAGLVRSDAVARQISHVLRNHHLNGNGEQS